MTDLTKDPLFQLNSLLWLTQPLPDDGEIVPVLYKQGFIVYAIAPPLGLPLDVSGSLKNNSIVANDSVRPDIVLENPEKQLFFLIECKADSFSTDSSNVFQVRTLLLISGNRLSEILGGQKLLGAILGLVLPDDCVASMSRTLGLLSNELSSKGMSTGEFTVPGLSNNGREISVTFDDNGKRFLGLEFSRNVFLRFEPETDFRPLYFIPYDPDIDQSETERFFCKCLLFERIKGTIVAGIGHTTPPGQVIFSAPRLLNDAMFGMFGHWENRNSSTNMRRLCKQFMETLRRELDKELPGMIRYDGIENWIIDISDGDGADKLIDLISSFSCKTSRFEKPAPLDLLDIMMHGPDIDKNIK